MVLSITSIITLSLTVSVFVLFLVLIRLAKNLINLFTRSEEEMSRLMRDTEKLQEDVNTLTAEIAVLKTSVENSMIETGMIPKRYRKIY